MATDATPEFKAALTKAVAADAIFLVVGGVLFFFTDQIFWLIGFAVAGTAVMLLLLAQAGAFKGRDGDA